MFLMFSDEIMGPIMEPFQTLPVNHETLEHNDLDSDAASTAWRRFFFLLCQRYKRAFFANHHWQPAEHCEEKKVILG
jgi:hypothetical protein